MRVFLLDVSSYAGKTLTDIFSAAQHEVVSPKSVSSTLLALDLDGGSK